MKTILTLALLIVLSLEKHDRKKIIENENINCLFKKPSKPGRSGDHDFTTRPHPTRHMIAVCRHVTHGAIRLNVAIYKNNISIYHTPTANTEEEETVSQILHVYTERVIM